MGKTPKIIFAAAMIFFTLYLLTQSYGPLLFSQAENYIAGPFFVEKITPEDLKSAYGARKIRVLIVPGHDNDKPGAVYKKVREADLNLDLGLNLFHALQKDSNFEPFIVRKESGDYNDWFKDYLNQNTGEISAFRQKLKNVFSSAVTAGDVTTSSQVYHNPAADNASLYLYAVNKVANDYKIDIVVHLHFNDYPGRRKSLPGKYSGFAVYVPDSQLPNARVSKALGEGIKNRLSYYNPGSNLKGESGILVEDQELIAVGSNASRDGASVLIEYAYIYEPQLQLKPVRDATLNELAYQTYLGLADYFLSPEKRAGIGKTTLFPKRFTGNISLGEKGSNDVLAFQAILKRAGFYPPEGENLNTCPISGTYGDCTKRATQIFQGSIGLKNSNGAIDSDGLKKAGLLSESF